MKTLIITLLFLGLTISSYSQVKTEVMKEGIMKVQDLPAVVIKCRRWLSVYLPTWMLIQKSEHWKIVS
jgi:hypothetical protein